MDEFFLYYFQVLRFLVCTNLVQRYVLQNVVSDSVLTYSLGSTTMKDALAHIQIERSGLSPVGVNVFGQDN